MSDSNNPSLILTRSQEIQLLSDTDVGSMLHLLNEQTQPIEDDYDYPEFSNALVSDTSNEVNQYIIAPSEIPNTSEISTTSSETPIIPPSKISIAPPVISNEDYSGPYEFEILIKSPPGNNNWVYSEKLNKLYTTNSYSIPIDFKWKSTLRYIYVRATPLFSSPHHAQELVKRCLPHSSPSDPSNIDVPSERYDHILRCQHSSAYYYGSVESNTHLNVIVPLGQPQAGTDVVRIMYSFVCNNSCPSGMDRKALEVVFTLEDEAGNVHGRKKVAVRVCSCPKRDKEKEEKGLEKLPSKGKKLIRGEKRPHPHIPVDNKSYTMNVVGTHNFYKMAKIGFDIITTDMAERGSNPTLKANQEQFNNFLKTLKN